MRLIKKIQILLILVFISIVLFKACRKKPDNPVSIPTKLAKGSIKHPKDTIKWYNDSTIAYSHRDIARAERENSIKDLSNIYFKIGIYYYGKNTKDSSYMYFNSASKLFLEQKDSVGLGKSLVNMSIIQIIDNDYYGGEETAVEALKYLKKGKDDANIAAIYSGIAMNKRRFKDYKKSQEYFEKSLELLDEPKAIGEKENKVRIKNNYAISCLYMGDYDKAIQILLELMRSPEFKGASIVAQLRAKDNLVYTYWKKESSYPRAEEKLLGVLGEREKIKDSMGMQASYLHLSDYYTKVDKNKAIYYASELYRLAKRTRDIQDQLVALERLVYIEGPEESKKYFSDYVKLIDSMESVRRNAESKFALIRYEVKKKQDENLVLTAEKNYHILKQRVIIVTVIALSISLLLFAIFWYKKRSEKFKKEKLEEVQKTELKYSKKIHDEVANGIYHLMIRIDEDPELKRIMIVDELERLYNKSRNISHESEFQAELKSDFTILIKGLFQVYGEEKVKVLSIGNENKVWDRVPVEIREEVYYILKELLVNMKKHSEATVVSIKFSKEDSLLVIEYYDNGKGVGDKDWGNNKGLRAIEMRLRSLKQGEVVYNEVKREGFSVKISFIV